MADSSNTITAPKISRTTGFERFKWEDESTVPEEVNTIRRRQRTVRGASSELEQVFHYRRWLSLSQVSSSPLPADSSATITPIFPNPSATELCT